MKKIRYALEAALLHFLFFVFKRLSPRNSSRVGGAIGRIIGPQLAVNRKARRHLLIAFPGIPKKKQDVIIKGMWDNLGRLIAEYPHLKTIGKHHTEINAPDSFYAALKGNRPLLFIGGHIGNWEVNSAATLEQLGHKVDATYRAPNNPWTDKLLSRARTMDGRLNAYPKSQNGGRMMIKSLKNNGSIGMLIDQKYNEGVEIPFFGAAAMTNPAFVQFCKKYDCLIFPIRNERLEGDYKFRLTVCDPLNTQDDNGDYLSTENIIKQAHDLIESWITERPEQWIWLHRRWKS